MAYSPAISYYGYESFFSDSYDGHLDPLPNLELVSLTKLSSEFERLLLGSRFDYTDAEIEVEHSVVKAHRCILAARSPFFDDLFSKEGARGPGQEKKTYKMSDLVPNGHVGREAFKGFLHYVYTGKPKLTNPSVDTCVDRDCMHDACRPAIDYAVELMYASSTFQVKELVPLIKRHLLSFVEKAFVEDLVPILLVAFRCNLDDLFNSCVQKVASSDLDDIFLKKELSPTEIFEKIMSIRIAQHKSIPQNQIESSIDTGYEQCINKIYMALDSDDIELLKMLLVESKITLDDAFALHYAAAYCDANVVTEVLELGLAGVNKKNRRGFTPLHVAAMRREPSIIISLLDKGAIASELTENCNRTALDICKRLTRPKDNCEYCACINILEEKINRDPSQLEETVPLPSLGSDLQAELQKLVFRVMLAMHFFPIEAKSVFKIAEVLAKYSLAGSKGYSGSLTIESLEKTVMLLRSFLPDEADKVLTRCLAGSKDFSENLMIELLKKTVELGCRYFPSCSRLLNQLILDDRLDSFSEEATDEPDQKRMFYLSTKKAFSDAFNMDKARNGRTSGRKRSHVQTKNEVQYVQ